MNLFNFDIAAFVGFLMVFVRMSGLMLTLPVFGSSSIPTQVRIGLTAVISYIVYTVVQIPPIDLGMSILQLTLALAGELAIGLTIGFAAQLVFTAVQLAGQMIGFQMGFAIVNVMDPATNSQVSITAQFQNMMALLIFLAINGHHWLIFSSAQSFNLIPMFGFTPSADLVALMITLTKNVFITAVKLAAPIMATLFFLNVALGLVARTVPQMNVFIVGFPLQIAIGLFMLGATAPIFSYIFRNSLFGFYENVVILMKTM